MKRRQSGRMCASIKNERIKLSHQRGAEKRLMALKKRERIAIEGG